MDEIESGILSWSWNGWKEAYNDGSVHLFLDGFAAPDPSMEPRNDTRCIENHAGQIIDLYKCKGSGFVDSLRGSFAIALWDARERKLILATDHFGTRPIYYMIWLDFALECGYVDLQVHKELASEYEQVGKMLGSMISTPEKFCYSEKK